ncbi:CBM96 family carbohydrate-binding protein [Longispora urticae]
MSEDGRPCPENPGTPEEFVDALRRLKDWHGLSFRELEKRAAARGDVLPRATLTTALGRSTLPREELVAAFVRACCADEEQVQRWAGARRRLAAGEPAEPAVRVGPVPHGAADAAEQASVGPGEDSERPTAGLAAVTRTATEPASAVTATQPAVTVTASQATMAVSATQPAVAAIPPELAAGVLTVAWRRTSFPIRVMTALVLILVATVTTAAVVRAVRDFGGGNQAMSQDDNTPDETGTPGDEPSASPQSSPSPAEDDSGDGGDGGTGGPGGTGGGGTGGPGGSGGVAGGEPTAGPSPAGPGPATPGPDNRPVTATFAATDDTTIWRGAPDATGFGTQDDASTCGEPCANSSTPGFQRQVLVKFDAHDLPADRCASAVHLRLWAKNAPGAVRVHRLGTNWSESSATWNKRPARGAELTRSRSGGSTGWIVYSLPSGKLAPGAYAYELEGLDSQTAGFGTRESGQAAQLVITHQRCG